MGRGYRSGRHHSWFYRVLPNSNSNGLGYGRRHFLNRIIKSFSYVLVQAVAEN